MNAKHQVKKDARRPLMLCFKAILYSPTDEEAVSNYKKLIDCCNDLKCETFPR